MREYMFRGLRSKNRGWEIGFNIEKLNDNVFINHCVVDPDTVTQYVGIKDIHDTPIFEGDIVKHLWIEDNKDDYDIGVIYWDSHGVSYRRTTYRNRDIIKDYKLGCHCHYEVLGNIYENKVEDFLSEEE